MIINVHIHVRRPLCVLEFNETLIFFLQIFEKSSNIKFN